MGVVLSIGGFQSDIRHFGWAAAALPRRRILLVLLFGSDTRLDVAEALLGAQGGTSIVSSLDASSEGCSLSEGGGANGGSGAAWLRSTKEVRSSCDLRTSRDRRLPVATEA